MGRISSRQRYSSPLMQERRRRIMAEARALLAEGGEAGFNMRELSRRAGVSSRTLYHALLFGLDFLQVFVIVISPP
ncbi:TetR/AcrR family transcriptional regulator [Sphingosinicella soli]|nr:helix-turn-helix domain containing protein [Sphingosinicella soli]